MDERMFYPAIFQPEEEGGFSIIFPDVKGCITQGEDMNDGYEMAFDALGNMLSYLEESGKEIPNPSEPQKIHLDEGQFLVVIEFNMLEYKKKNDSRAVKKTLTIPSWLNEVAIRQNINFSQVLQEALMARVKQ
ncbi:type II toxin-antitoxin system HicB family antitoxin [Clostridium sp. Marseille-P2415]|uniref:type II toxin-antitoxin system HicB family antitoxin n=1 Tax=Clostridium sp. Marseille-P2415 TaxID=1805471 RepID=UPI0009887E1A|nr:type II toxin-antitoxin system HicB family antitoxin [Clostridium sp. Marseille-P2415]